MADDGKRSEVISTKATERVALDLLRVSALDDRSPSEYVYLLIRRHLYGIVRADEPTTQPGSVDKVDQ